MSFKLENLEGLHLTPPRHISSKLLSLKKELYYKAGDVSEKQNVIRATNANLIVIRDKSSDTEAAFQKNLVDKLSSEYPSRIFILDTEFNSPSASLVSSKVALKPQGKLNNQELFSEEIHLSFSKEGIKALPNLILANLISDVKPILLFLSKFQEGKKEILEEILSHLNPWIERLIFDSSLQVSYSFPVTLFKAAGFEKEKNNIRLYDLNWNRLEPLRSFIAEVFENSEVNILKNLNKIKITSALSKNKTLKNETFLIICWFLETLNLGFRKFENNTIYASSDSGEKLIELEFKEEEERLKIDFELEGRKIEIIRESVAERLKLTSLVDSSIVSSYVHNDNFSLENLLTETIHTERGDFSLEKVLKIASEIEKEVSFKDL